MISETILSPANDKEYSKEEFKLYLEYKKELWDILGTDGEKEEICQHWYQNILDSDCFLIRIYDGKTQVGFVLIAIGENCPEFADFYIQDCYLKSEYRRKHVMWNLMDSFLGHHPGRYCFFLIDENKPAKNFWKKLFESWGYQFNTKATNLIVKGMEDRQTHFYCYM